jgi:hypothetical protein
MPVGPSTTMAPRLAANFSATSRQGQAQEGCHQGSPEEPVTAYVSESPFLVSPALAQKSSKAWFPSSTLCMPLLLDFACGIYEFMYDD